MREVEDHLYPLPMFVIPIRVLIISALLHEGLPDFMVNVLLLQDHLVIKGNVGVQVLEAGCLAETDELIVDEAILDGVEFVNIIYHVLTGGSHEGLNKGLSAEGDTKTDVALSREAVSYTHLTLPTIYSV